MGWRTSPISWALVETDHRALRIGLFGVEIEHILHAGDMRNTMKPKKRIWTWNTARNIARPIRGGRACAHCD
jgi:hypothetical protein